MPNPYKTQAEAWRWVLVMFLQATAGRKPINISPTSSLHTTRSRLFGGRQFINSSLPDSPLHRYRSPSEELTITTDTYRLIISPSEEFFQEWANVPPDVFTETLRRLPSTRKETMTFHPAGLNMYQIPILREYFSTVFAKVLITPTMVTVVPR